MKYKKLDNWEYQENLEQILYVAQLFEELLFDYTLDSYKPSTLNSNSLCEEALKTIQEIDLGTINRGACNPIIDELIWSLKGDSVAKELIGGKLDIYVRELKSGNTSLESKKSIIELIELQFNGGKFLKEIVKQLINNLYVENNKKALTFLTRILITELRNSGYQSGFIYHTTQNFFFSQANLITRPSQLKEFLKTFNLKRNKYQVVFLASKEFRDLADSCDRMGLKIVDEFAINNQHAQGQEFLNKKSENNVFIIADDLEMLDPNSAYEEVDSRIETINNLFNFYHHKADISWTEDALIQDKKSNYTWVLTKPTPSVLKCKDTKQEKATQKLRKTIMNFGMKDRNSFRRFDTAMDLHALAVNTRAIENQLINLWTALETLIPKLVNSGKDRIIQISDVLTPFLTINYVEKHIIQINYDLLKWNYEEYRSLIAGINEGAESDTTTKIGAFLSMSKYDELREQLYGKLGDYPLLKFRIYMLYERMNNPEKLLNALKRHIKRVEWQIHRVYRTRNLIVHSGSLPKYADGIVENLHAYLDSLLDTVIDLVQNEKSIGTLEQAYSEISIRWNYHLAILEQMKKKDVDESSFFELLFGYKIKR